MSRAERPRWRVNVQSFIGHALVNEGDEVYYTPPVEVPATAISPGSPAGHVSENLSPLNDAAQEIVDTQKRDHPDKAIHAGKRAKAAALSDEEQMEQEQDRGDGLVPARARKGDTKAPPKPKRGAKPAEPDPEPTSSPGEAPDEDDDDVG